MPKISFYVNQEFVTADVPRELTVLEFLREERGLTGAKEGCNEGDCGACTIAVGELQDGQMTYRAVNSCLMLAPKMHGRHIVTVEGLSEGDQLHPVPQAIVDHHGIQCGYCTPGVLMSLFSLFLENPTPSEGEIREAMDGTLCRCTGYAPIHRAAAAVAESVRKNALSRDRLRPAYFDRIADQLKKLEAESWSDSFEYSAPRNLGELFAALEPLATGDGQLIAGATDVMVDVHAKSKTLGPVIDLTRVDELRRIEITPAHLVIGGGVTLNDVLHHDVVISRFPALSECLRQMCSTQIRNVATLAGNLCTASPIADSIPPLMVYGAEVVIASRRGQRRVPVREFFRGYRQTVLGEREIVVSIEIPFDHYRASFEKTGKRRALDIASVNSALGLKLKGERIADARLVFGGVGPVPFLAAKTCAFLSGKSFTESVMSEAAEMAAAEIRPISDVRGSAGFRRVLTRNHVMKHFVKLAANTMPTKTGW